MSNKNEGAPYTILVSDSFEQTDEHHVYEVAFRRWLVREMEEEKLTVAQAIERFNFNPKNAFELIRKWRERYASSIVVNLPIMNAKEKQEFEKLQARNKALEKQLEDAKMKNIALDMLIDVAEEKLKISIRKKPGAKQ